MRIIISAALLCLFLLFHSAYSQDKCQNDWYFSPVVLLRQYVVTENLVNNFYRGAYGRDATTTEMQTQRDALNASAQQGLAQVQAQVESFGRSLFAG